MRRCPLLAAVLLVFTRAPSARAEEPRLPECLASSAGGSAKQLVQSKGLSDAELLARLAYAEGKSTGFADDPLVYRSIAWGVMNRVRLSEASAQMARRHGRGVAGVVFKEGQFNPALSPRSKFSRDFLCPDHAQRWALARAAAARALSDEPNPFLATDWEKRHGLSLVVNFYYPASTQAKGQLAPWESGGELQFVGAVRLSGGELSPERVRFYRLARPPSDVPKPR